jgi:hypothetical protein
VREKSKPQSTSLLHIEENIETLVELFIKGEENLKGSIWMILSKHRDKKNGKILWGDSVY